MIGGLILVSKKQWRQHKLRTLFTILGIAIGVAAFFAFQTASETLNDELRRTVEKLAGRAQLQITAGEAGFSEDYLSVVRKTDGVLLAEPAIESITKTSKNESLLILGLDTTSELKLHSEIVPESGIAIENPLAFINRADSIAVTTSFADTNGLGSDSKIELLTQQGAKQFTVRGTFKPIGVGEIFGGNVAVMDIVSMQQMFGREGLIDRIDIQLADSVSTESAIREIRSKLPDGIEVNRPSQRGRNLENAFAGVQVGMGLMSFLAIAISLFIIFNSFFVSVSQRYKEIGILRALGVDRRRIQFMFLGESAVLGLVGSIVGVAAGYVLAIGAIRILSEVGESGFGIISAPRMPMITLSGIAAAIGIGIIASLLGAWLPAREAGRADPVTALRNLKAGNRGRKISLARAAAGILMIGFGLVFTWFATPAVGMAIQLVYWMLILVGMILLLPAFVRFGSTILRPLANKVAGIEGVLAVDSMSRTPRRTTATVGALMIGLSFVISNGALIESQKAALAGTLDRSVNADFFVTNSEQIRSRTYHFSEATANRVAEVKGVKQAENLRVTTVRYEDMEVAVLAHDMKGWLTRSPNALDEGDPAAVRDDMAGGNGFFVSQNFAFRFGVELGDDITIESPGGNITRKVLGILEYYQSEIGTVFLDRVLYKQYWKDTSVDYILVTAEPGFDRIRLKKSLESAVAGEQQVFVYSHAEYRNWVMGLIDRFFLLNYVQMIIAVLIGGLSLVNTMFISVFERTRELSILRAVGSYRSQIARMVIYEAVFVSLIGIGTGLLAGFFNAYCTLNISVVVVAGYSLPFHFPFGLVLIAVPIVVLISALSAFYPARHAALLNVSEGLIYE